jgi:hypothetical protein
MYRRASHLTRGGRTGGGAVLEVDGRRRRGSGSGILGTGRWNEGRATRDGCIVMGLAQLGGAT